MEELLEALSRKNWFEASRLTAALLRETSGLVSGETILPGSFDNAFKRMGCAPLARIDQAWLEASEGRFGFTPQLEAFQKAHGAFARMGEELAWRDESGWLPPGAKPEAPRGYFPHFAFFPSFRDFQPELSFSAEDGVGPIGWEYLQAIYDRLNPNAHRGCC